MSDNRETPEPGGSPVKIDQIRNIPGGTLLRTVPAGGQPARYMMATPVQSSSALISSTTTIQTQVLPKVTGPGGTTTGVTRISSVPIQAPSTTGYHVPRGAAAVANISVPRSSVATPIVRGPATLQTINVAQQHVLPASGSGGRPVVACLPGQQRPQAIPVGARLVSAGGVRAEGTARPVLLHAATHKQVTLTQQQVQMSGAGGGAGVKSYSNTTTGRHGTAPALSRITTATLPPGIVQLPGAVFLPPQAIKTQQQPKVVSGGQVVSGGAQAGLTSTGGGGNVVEAGTATVQLATGSLATPHLPQLSISTVVSRPGDVTVVLGSGTVGQGGNALRAAANAAQTAMKATIVDSGTGTVTGGTASGGTQTSHQPPQLYLPSPAPRGTILVREAPRAVQGQQHSQQDHPPISISVSSSSGGGGATGSVNTLYTLPTGGGLYFEGTTVRPLVSLPSRPIQQQVSTGQQTGVQTSGGGPGGNVTAGVRLNPVMLVDPSHQQGGASHQPQRLHTLAVSSAPTSISLSPLSDLHSQGSGGGAGGESRPVGLPGLQASGGLTSHSGTQLALPHSVVTSASGSTTSNSGEPGAPPLSCLPKQVVSPRPTILRKRDPDGSPMKGQKNLTPLLTSLGTGTEPGLPPSPPGGKRGGDSSSGGSSTMSAQSSPGDSPPTGSQAVQGAGQPGQEEEGATQPLSLPPVSRLPPPVSISSSSISSQSTSLDVSPRKKPRKQQLSGTRSGNQTNAPNFSEDEMEFISEDKHKKDLKEEMESKVIPKRKTMSLLSSYKNMWKPRNNHFLRYSDVKPKDERNPTLVDLANQKNVVQRVNGWKIYHLSSQIEDAISNEEEFVDFYNSLLAVLEINQKKSRNKDFDKEYSRLNERVKANFQRTKVVKDQMVDAKGQMMKFFDHKTYVADLISKNISKRNTSKKRDRF